MKACKKVLVGLMTSVMLLSSAMVVSAANSPSVSEVPTLDETTQESFEIKSGDEAVAYFAASGIEEDVVDAIASFNDAAGTSEASVDTLVADAPEAVKTEVKGAAPLTEVFDLQPKADAKPDADGKYEVAMTVTLPANTVKVLLLHYSTAKTAWEAITAESFDIATGKIVVKIGDFSPVMVLAQTKTTDDTTQQPDDTQDSDDQTSDDQTTEEPAAPEAPAATSPKTGAASAWALWMGAAAALTATGSVVCKKRK